MQMTADGWITFALLGVLFGLLIATRIPPAELLKGFSNQGVRRVGASCSFISPMGYQTNLMVYRPGGYKFADFARMGVPLTLLVGVITVWLTPIVFPF
jgi:hypothetical protein